MLSVGAYARLTTARACAVTARGLPPNEDDAVHGANAQTAVIQGARSERAKSTLAGHSATRAKSAALLGQDDFIPISLGQSEGRIGAKLGDDGGN